MSQAKVDRYKEEKKNRQQIMKKEKRERMLTNIGLGVVAAAMVVWVGVSAYNGITSSSSDTETAVETENYVVNVSALEDYLDSLSTD